MYITTDAIILKNINYRETSVISRIFTYDYGKISIIFKGAKRKNNNITSIIELGNVVNITYYAKSTSDLKTSREVSLVYHYPSSHKVLLNYYYNMAIISLLDKLCHEDYPHNRLYRSAIQTMKIIDLNQYSNDILFLYFLLNLNNSLGFKISSDNPELQLLIDKLENDINYIEQINNKLLDIQDSMNRIKIIIYKNMKKNLIDLNDIYAIKMLRKINND